MRNNRRWRSVVAALILAAFLPVTTTACFGKFQLTQKVYKFNQDIDGDKWIQWFAFLVLSIVPIYGISLVIDLVLANSVEFWSGSNPISSDSGTTKVVRGPDGTVMTLNRRGDGIVDVVLEREGRTLADFRVRGEGNGLSAWDADGRLLARVMDVEGRPVVVDGALR